MKLTERDMFLLAKIQSYGFLTTKQIQEDVLCTSTNRTTLLSRLRILESARYLQRFDGLRDYAVGWGLTQKSAKLFPDKVSKIHFPRHLRDHDQLLTRLRFKLESLRNVNAWIPEHEIRSELARRYGVRGIQERVVPDGIASIERQGVNESIAIELELFGKSSKRYRQSHAGYSSNKSLFGVWYIVGDKSIGRKLMKVWKTCPPYGPNFFWSELDDIQNNRGAAKVYGIGWEKCWGQILDENYNPNSYSHSPFPSLGGVDHVS
jgi:hypothetical protein